ncbi:MAG TPA: DegQ family serine endoprotease [Alphaproteobacteria bacterium]|nr:DegQ family serine endoprotease [Alphaproteobacteria bacterium]
MFSISSKIAAGAILLTLLYGMETATARTTPESFADLAEAVLPAVVNISTTQSVMAESGDLQEFEDLFRDFFDKQNPNRPQAPRRSTSLGSGFIIDPAGYIVTNNHVVSDAEEVTVRLYDDTNLKAEIVGRDEKTDLALLKVQARNSLPFVKWGDSDSIRIGDWVVAIGNPFGLGGSVTAGIVSARQREINAGPYDDFIQTDASINKGNSGGPMFNMAGEVIGINTAIFSPSGGSVGIGFAVPSALARHVIEQIREFGRTRRGWLGVNIQTVTDELAEGLKLPKASGALVSNVAEGSPAATAGIEKGDVILKFDGRDIGEMRRLPRIVADTPIDKTVDVLLWRKGREERVKVKIGELNEAEVAALPEQPEQQAPETAKIEALGMSLAEVTPELREKFQLEQDAAGVLVIGVSEGSVAAEKGLQPGDVVVEVDQKEVSTPQDVEAQIAAARKSGQRVVTFLIYRQGDFQWVALRVDQG